MSNETLLVIIILGDEALKKTKLKLKKQVWFALGGIFLTVIVVVIGVNIYQNAQYKKTNEYKFLQSGYTNEEIKLLEDNFSLEEMNTLADAPKDEFLLSLLQDEYFIKDNLSRYTAYHKENENISPREVVEIVNTNHDYDYYDHDIDTDISKDHLLLVNKYYHLGEDYEPEDLVDINNKYYYGDGHQIRKIVYDAFVDMWNQANQEGIYLIINSGYRSFKDQQEVYDFYKNNYGTTYADSIAARPGYSEHQTGLALDIFSTEYTSSDAFKNSSHYEWLVNNAYQYGFIQRYEIDTEDITGFSEEAWHWRYVGVEVATYLHEHDITFDEYYAYFIE